MKASKVEGVLVGAGSSWEEHPLVLLARTRSKLSPLPPASLIPCAIMLLPYSHISSSSPVLHPHLFSLRQRNGSRTLERGRSVTSPRDLQLNVEQNFQSIVLPCGNGAAILYALSPS